MSMFEKRVDAAREGFRNHRWSPTTRLCTCGEFFEASLAGHELRVAHRMGKAISAADAVVPKEQSARPWNDQADPNSPWFDSPWGKAAALLSTLRGAQFDLLTRRDPIEVQDEVNGLLNRLDELVETMLAADAVVTEEAPRVQLHAQRGGKTSRMIDQILDRADERGVTIEVVYPEPTEEMIADTLCSYQRHTGDRECEYDHETARAILALFRGGAK